MYNANDILNSQRNELIFILSKDGKIYAGVPDNGIFHHTSFLSGADIATAGEIKFVDDTFIINNFSGHYKPLKETLVNILNELIYRGVNIKIE